MNPCAVWRLYHLSITQLPSSAQVSARARFRFNSCVEYNNINDKDANTSYDEADQPHTDMEEGTP